MTPPAASQPGAPAVGGEADVLAAAVLSCPAVAKLSVAGSRRIATYLPGRRVEGVRTGDDRIEVGVVVRLGVTAAEVDRQVRSALAPHTFGRPVDLRIADVQLPAELAADEAAKPLALPAGETAAQPLALPAGSSS